MVFHSGSESKVPLSALAVGSVAMGICAVVLVYAGPLLGAVAVAMGVMAMMVIKKGESGAGPERQGKGLAFFGIAAGVMGIVIPMMIYVAAPECFSLERPRELLGRVVDAKRADVLVRAACSQAKANEGRMPPHLAAVVVKWLPQNRHVLLVKGSQTPILSATIRNDAAWESIASQVDEASDYVYVGADVNVTGLGREAVKQVIVLYSKEDVYADGGRLVGFADGRVALVGAEGLADAFANSNRQRALLQLVAVAMDGPPPSPVLKTAETTPVGGATQEVVLPKEIVTVTDALEALKGRDVRRRHEAIGVLLRTPAEVESRREVSVLLGQCVADPVLRLDALAALKTWGSKENVQGLIGRLNTLKDNDPLRPSILLALGGTGDVEQVAGRLVEELKKEVARQSAIEALVLLGSGVEPVVVRALNDVKAGAAACDVLAKVGTERSLAKLEEIGQKRNSPLKVDAEVAIKAIRARMEEPQGEKPQSEPQGTGGELFLNS
ncbi:MAG: hypothetical protein FWD53_12900, partial [Phycisphaerales bacterium]|nr:hypothetical protein [Phycisphaerales bacterium]